MSFPLVSLCGSYHANKDWYPRCISSWDRIRGSEEVLILDDGSLTLGDENLITSHGYDILALEDVNERIEPILRSRPALRWDVHKKPANRSL